MIINLLTMILLLTLSAFFSGAETALFSLSGHTLEKLKTSGKLSERSILSVLNRPSEALVAILLGNLIINVLFFCVSSVIFLELSEGRSFLIKTLLSISVLFLVIIFGEVMPKACGINYALSFSRIIALPLNIWMTTSKPILKVIIKINSFCNDEKHSTKKSISSEELKMLLNYSRDNQDGLSSSTSELLEDIVELSELKVRHFMKPRVDLVLASVDDPIDKIVDLAIKNRVYFIPVYEDSDENIIGFLNIKDICLKGHYNCDIKSELIPVHFIPENSKCSTLLDRMNQENLRTLIVVDEYGGFSGLVTFRDVFRDIFNTGESLHLTDRKLKVEPISENSFRVHGSLSIKDWDDFFTTEVTDHELDFYAINTVAGLVISLLGHYPKVGDQVSISNLKFTIDEISEHRINWLTLEVE